MNQVQCSSIVKDPLTRRGDIAGRPEVPTTIDVGQLYIGYFSVNMFMQRAMLMSPIAPLFSTCDLLQLSHYECFHIIMAAFPMPRRRQTSSGIHCVTILAQHPHRINVADLCKCGSFAITALERIMVLRTWSLSFIPCTVRSIILWQTLVLDF